jgi:hypothetical membrane protein
MEDFEETIATMNNTLLSLLKTPAFFQVFSVTGASSAILGALIAGLVYRGKRGERYSVLNHYISELGEQGISRLAWVFNLGLILCGLCLLPACISLGLLLPGALSKLGMAAGIVAAISVSLVGVYPMNNLTPHIRAAVTYFRLGLGMVLFFALAIALQSGDAPVLPRLFSLAGLPAVLAFAYFLIYSRISYATPQNPLTALEGERPRVWVMAVAEWAIFLTTVPWFLAIAAGL